MALHCRVKDLKEKKKRLKEVFKKLGPAMRAEAEKRDKLAAKAKKAEAAAAVTPADDPPEEFDELAEPVNPTPGTAADEPVATLRGPVSANVLAQLTAPAPAVAEVPFAGTARVLPKNIVECVLIKRRAELLGALDIKSLSAVFQTSSTLTALAEDASTWHRVYAARRAAPRLAPEAGLAQQTEDQDYAPLLGGPFGGGGGGGGAPDDDDGVQRMAALPVHAMAMNVDDDEEEAPAEPLMTVDEALGGAQATAAAKRALLRAEAVAEEALGEDPGDAHVLLAVTNGSAGKPFAIDVVVANGHEERAALDKLLEPAGVRSSWLSLGGSEYADRVRPPMTIGEVFGADGDDADADEEGVLPPLIYQQDGVPTGGKIATVTINYTGQPRVIDNQVPLDLDLAIAIRECTLELKDQKDALDAIKDDLRQWEGLKVKVENGTVKVSKSKGTTYGVGLKVDRDLWENTLDDDMREALVRAGFVRMKYARAEGTRLTTKNASAAQHALDAARRKGRVLTAATIQGKTVRGEACRYDAYESS